MDSITINFHGDIHISISPDSANRLMQSMNKLTNDGAAAFGDISHARVDHGNLHYDRKETAR